MLETILKFLKDRFSLVIIFLIVFACIRPLNIKDGIYIIVVLTAVLLVHNFLHELSHAIFSVLLGMKVTKVTINRVYLEDEPSSFEEIRNSSNKIKYGIIAISGSIITILSGYILLFVAHNLRQGIGLVNFLCWIFTLVVFLLGDSCYLMIGGLSMQGDPVGISAGLGVSRWIIFCFGFIIAIVNTLLIWRFFWLAA